MLSIGSKQFTISLTYTVNIDESVLRKPARRSEEDREEEEHQREMQQRLLHQLTQNPQELTNIILENIIEEITNLESSDWEDLFLNKNHLTHPEYFDRDNLLPTIRCLDEADQRYWMNLYQMPKPSPEEIEQVRRQSVDLPPWCIVDIPDQFLEGTMGLFESIQVELSDCDIRETTEKTSSSRRHHSNQRTRRKRGKGNSFSHNQIL